MKYLSARQVGLNLKMGRELAQFIGVGKYFESTTFEWVRLFPDGEEVSIELIRSFDEGDEHHTNVALFSTSAEQDSDEVYGFSGSLNLCLDWLENEIGGSRDKFVKKEEIGLEYQKVIQAK